MKTIETIVNVSSDGKMTIQLPLDIPPGEYQVVILLDEKAVSEELSHTNKVRTLKFSEYPVGLVSENFTFRREDLYDQ